MLTIVPVHPSHLLTHHLSHLSQAKHNSLHKWEVGVVPDVCRTKIQIFSNIVSREEKEKQNFKRLKN